MEEIVKYVILSMCIYFGMAIIFMSFFYESVFNRKQMIERSKLYNRLLNVPLPEPTRWEDSFRFELGGKHLWLWDDGNVSLHNDKDCLMCYFRGDIPARIKMKKIKKIIKEKIDG